MTPNPALLRRALKGDPEAFRLLYDLHAGAVFGYALRMLRDRHGAEDVVQEVFFAILRRGGRYDAARPFLPWLLAITRSESINHMRKRKRNGRAVEPERLEASTVPANHDAADFIETALGRVPEPYREALWLCDALDLSYQESAEIMDCNPSTVGSRLSRGRKMLQTLLTRNGHAL